MKRQFYFALSLQLLMVVLMAIFPEKDPLVVRIIDIFLATSLNWILWIRAERQAAGVEEEAPVLRMQVSPQIKLKWFTYYVVLTLGLVLIMMYQTSFIPHHVRGK